MTQLFDKNNVDAVELSADGWSFDAETDTYTSTSDTASATVGFRPPRADQTHNTCKVGSTFQRRSDGSWKIKVIT